MVTNQNTTNTVLRKFFSLKILSWAIKLSSTLVPQVLTLVLLSLSQLSASILQKESESGCGRGRRTDRYFVHRLGLLLGLDSRAVGAAAGAS